MPTRATHGSFRARSCPWPVHPSAGQPGVTKVLLAFCCLICLGSLRLSAATISITSTNEGVLRAALAGAASGDTIRIDLRTPPTNSDYTNYTMILLTNGELVINKDLTLIGVGENLMEYPILDARSVTRVFKIVSGNVCLRNLIIQNGNASDALFGAGIYNLGNLSVSNCTFAENQTFLPIGTNCSGGAIFNLGTLNIQWSLFSSNGSSANGGALYNAGTALIKNSSFSYNYAGWRGGAIYNGGSLTLSDSAITENFSVSTGGAGLGNESNALACISNCQFNNNTNVYYGGGAILNGGELTVTNSVFAGNVADKDSGDTGISGGGALFNEGGVASLARCMIGPTNSANRGGGILNYSALPSAPALLVMNACSFYNNSVSMWGGGLMNWASGGPAAACLTNCTLSYNAVNMQNNTAGGVDNTAFIGSATVNLMNCTLVSNLVYWPLNEGIGTANNVLSGVFGGSSAQAEVKLCNTILFGTDKGYQGQVYGSGKLTSLGYNLCSDLNTSFTTTNATDIRNRPAQVTALLPDGPILYHALAGNSPAIDKGNPTNSPAYDAVGNKRPFGRGFDIGAVEQTLAFLNFSNTNFSDSQVRTFVDLWFTPYIYATNYTIEYSTNCAPGSWNVLTIMAVNGPYFMSHQLFTNVVYARHTRGGPGVATNKAYFYRIKIP